MFALCRNINILRNPEAASLAAFRSRFLSFIFVNLILGGLYLYETYMLVNLDSTPDTIPDMIKYLPFVVGTMFLVDAVLMCCLRSMSKSEGGKSAKITAIKVNVIANLITIFTYGYNKVTTLQWLASSDVDQGVFAYILIIFICISKITGIMVIYAFRKWLRAHEAAESAAVHLAPQMTQPAQVLAPTAPPYQPYAPTAP
eukprot:gnl/MRDRNA2_/MRDRNA2_99456_c0_seq1.p1 gnl/MRDRNA2_/MRDRNA2_99456_c0~~gnl/MRDRNA2_/MRDRNA2_99456_c0_seq1.p1  ORF type:complete len:200 (-),score=24.35 gnl/MRDRNA2_/MRDRNA2_99456_c0_seq1:52-651(-)